MKVLMCFLLILFIALVSGNTDDDFAFDPEIKSKHHKHKVVKNVPVQRKWGVPDTQVVAGSLFILKIPDDAFSGDIDHFEIGGHGTHALPTWLELHNSDKTLKGVPLLKDIGEHYLVLRAVSPESQHKAKDLFSIEVMKPSLEYQHSISNNYKNCDPGKDPIMLTILMDTTLSEIPPKLRVNMLENIAGYLSLPHNIFYLHEQSLPTNMLTDATFFMGGSGNIKTSSVHKYAVISWQVGWGEKICDENISLIQKVKQEAKDGTLAEVLQRSVVGWHAKNEFPGFFRDRREVGSGDFYDEDLEEEEDYGEPITTSTTTTSRPHRHHHGAVHEEENNMIDIDSILQPSQVNYPLPTSPVVFDFENIISTPVLIPERPTLLPEPTVITSGDVILSTRVSEGFDMITPSTSQDLVTLRTSDGDRYQQVTVPLIGSTNDNNYTDSVPDSSTSNTDYWTSSSSSSSSQTTDEMTSPSDLTTVQDTVEGGAGSSGSSSSSSNSPVYTTQTTSRTTEEMEPETANFKPTIQHRLKKLAATAGKVSKFTIPDDTFMDVEDGGTKDLKIEITHENEPVSSYTWFKFDPAKLQVVVVPLEEHVSKWEFQVEATDKDGDSVSDTLELSVQHHKGRRTVNHEISMYVSIDRVKYRSPVDWQVKLIEALVKVYSDLDDSHIITRSVVSKSEPMIFTWTNDTLPKSYCPKEDIDRLLKVISIDGVYPLESLQEAVEPGIFVKKISYQGYGQCETKPETPLPPPLTPRENFAPVPRNQIDQINATAGQLLVFSVPEDTFYDDEDGGSRNLKMSLLNMDRSPLDPTHWLQFDSKNQEFYGVPMDSDVKRQEYQLVCEDRHGLTANDGLVVVVHPRHKQLYNVIFNLAVDVPYSVFYNSADMKRKFFNKLKELFNDADASSIVLQSISEGSTILSWNNRSLPTDVCPEADIYHLREVLINEDQIMTERLLSVMGTEFPVISAGLEPGGLCLGELTVLHKPESPAPPVDETHIVGPSDDYLITFVIPAVIILVMLILSGIIACLFYRRRRTNKMGIGDEDERQSFRNKGIPVIFQDELEEKPEPENKCPVIMKEEKPPLPPPEYQRGYDTKHESSANEDTPYHPPPPFTSNRDTGRNTRPKPTPTYRKPPPYVPP